MSGPANRPPPYRGRLPSPLTSFVGRQRELQELAAELESARLLTLVGAGGMGKTRLALELAAASVEDFDDGVWFVELAPLAAGSTIDHAVATTVGFQSQADLGIRDLLREGLSSWEALLVLDNCEHVGRPAQDLVVDLLGCCARLSVLATSRAPLRVPGERVRSVGPLDATTDAAALLAERASAARPDFALGPGNAEVVGSICEHLDGMPLAIELAAARLRSMTPLELLDRLHQRFRLLRADRAGLRSTGRHATLATVIDWSYDLLSVEQRRLLVALGTFAGSFDLPAAHALHRGGEDPDADADADQLDTLDLLDTLVDQSLVQTTEVDGRTGYSLLETLRHYVLDRQTAEQRSDLRVRHAVHFLGLARAGDEALRGREQAIWLRRLEREHDNLRAALAWSLGPDGDTATAVGLGAALGSFWRYRNHLDEGSDWLSRVLALPPEKATLHDHTRALIGAGLLDHTRRRYDAAQEHFHRARTVTTAAGDGDGLGWALHGLGRVALARGDRPAAKLLLHQSIDRFAEHGDAQGTTYSTFYLAAALMGEGGDLARARRLFDEGIDVAAASGDTWGLIGAYAWRSVFAARLGQEALAAHDFGRTLSGAAELGSTVMACAALYGLGRTAARGRHWILAAQLFGAAQTTSEAFGSTAAREGGPSAARLLEQAREVLGIAAFETAWSAGRALTFDDAVAVGCRAAETLGVADPAATPNDARRAALTEREWQIAQLVAEGRSNRQIAGALHLSVRTVENHLSHVYAKLGVGSRAELIVFVLRHAPSPA